MLRVTVALCLLGLAIAGPPVSRSRAEIEKFREYLESTRTDRGVRVGSPKGNVWQNSGKYQGDILLDNEQLESMVEQFAAGRNAYIWPNTRWPGNTVVYAFAVGHFNAAQRNHILYSIQVLEERTCIRFRYRNPGESNYVLLTTFSDGCYAHVGYWSTRGVHTMNLASNTPGQGCFTTSVVIHEWLHIIGFFHMHSTHDRDAYVRINWQNIMRGYEYAFDRHGTNIVSNLGLPYEYDSCMHYDAWAFSANGRTTMDALRPHSGVMGQISYVTGNDFLRVDRHYGCAAWKKAEDYQPFYAEETEVQAQETEVQAQETEEQAQETEVQAQETEVQAKETDVQAQETDVQAQETEEQAEKQVEQAVPEKVIVADMPVDN